MNQEEVEEMMRCYRLLPFRLLDVADFIESLPPEQFNMNHWWLDDGIAFDDERNKMYRVSDGPCGCAVGNMAAIGLFGITKDIWESPNFDTIYSCVSRGYIFCQVGKVFAINPIEAAFIFDQYAYTGNPTRCMVADRCRIVAGEYA